MRSTFAPLAALAVGASQVVGAFDLNVQDSSSIKSAASMIAKDLWSYYQGDTDPSQVGLLPKPYYWWEAGAMFGTFTQSSYLTGNHTYDKDVAAAIYSQASPTDDFMMLKSQSFDLGNDDQAFWALTAMAAAEHSLTPPSGQPADIWLTLASGAFNDLIGRWNTSYCNGGIKWQFIQSNNGYDYKSSIANGATMQLGARLALLTGNQTYADKAAMIYDWMQAIGFITDSYQVFDGAGDVPDNCTKIDDHEWSYNSAALIGGAAAMANYTAQKGTSDAKTWADRTTGLWQHASQTFFKNGVLYEQACEDTGSCDTDQWSFKAYMARWAAFAGQVVPSIQDDIQSKLQSTADAIAKSCSGNGTCGTKWYDGSYDGVTGVGQQMSALEVVAGLLAPSVPFVPGMAAGGSGSTNASTATSSSTSPTSTSVTNLPVASSSIVTSSTFVPPVTLLTSVVAASSSVVAPTMVASTPSAAQQAASGPTSTAAAVTAPLPGSSSSGSDEGSPMPVMMGSDGIPYVPQVV